jgi:Mg2+ and Co2+ transporter CorA
MPPDQLNHLLGDLDTDTRQLVQEIDNLTKLADYSNENYSNQPSSIFAPKPG